MAQCIIPNCTNDASHNLGIRCRRPNTSAIWAPNCNAYLCDAHAEQGCSIQIIVTPNNAATITTNVSSGAGAVITRTTPISHDAVEE
jgi:hypothetical protein